MLISVALAEIRSLDYILGHEKYWQANDSIFSQQAIRVGSTLYLDGENHTLTIDLLAQKFIH